MKRLLLIRLPRWLIVAVNYVFGLLHCVDVGDLADVSKEHAASIFRIEACRLIFCVEVYMAICFFENERYTVVGGIAYSV
jgi:hypothetical protein